MKPLKDQTSTDKAKNLHNLLPDQIKPFLVFVEGKTKTIIEKPSTLTDTLAADIPPEKWGELLQILNDTIGSNYERLCNDSSFFSEHLFKGFIGVFIIHCLQEYMNVCNDEQFFKAVELFFDV